MEPTNLTVGYRANDKTFIPSLMSKISLFKTKKWTKFQEIYAGSDRLRGLEWDNPGYVKFGYHKLLKCIKAHNESELRQRTDPILRIVRTLYSILKIEEISAFQELKNWDQTTIKKYEEIKEKNDRHKKPVILNQQWTNKTGE